ncbi:heat-shock protein [Pseudoalteromonas sp. NBT06-2]|uniref:Hsp20 family protein n=1 Tax=Pseudoalteromonas sp. NBT06-2 TaxID=2025950 RepID=UPI000BA76DE3|nr:Hsp20 family protein [Pseudoalteromonas sp. NBT06-2]PAJ75252.1 heat-shock protein [Pseudoalteromonas sp. NBT06-2]
MRTINFSPLNRSFIGFEQLTSLIDTAKRNDKKSNSIPYNIESFDDNKYRITMAVSGFTESELNIESQNKALKITGTIVPVEKVESEFVHQGLTIQNFEKSFQLGDHVKVLSANIENGLLYIDLEREIPEELKPRQIQIGKEVLVEH